MREEEKSRRKIKTEERKSNDCNCKYIICVGGARKPKIMDKEITDRFFSLFLSLHLILSQVF